jgi:hypothetical protein
MYVLTFGTGFPSAPTVVATTEFDGATASMIQTDGVTGASAVLRIRSKFDDEGPRDDAFHFMVIGPR